MIKIPASIKKYFKDKYINKLAIIDHVREVLWLYDNEYKPHKIYINLEKELIDLYILLHIAFLGKKELIEKRLEQFERKCKDE